MHTRDQLFSYKQVSILHKNSLTPTINVIYISFSSTAIISSNISSFCQHHSRPCPLITYILAFRSLFATCDPCPSYPSSSPSFFTPSPLFTLPPFPIAPSTKHLALKFNYNRAFPEHVFEFTHNYGHWCHLWWALTLIESTEWKCLSQINSTIEGALFIGALIALVTYGITVLQVHGFSTLPSSRES